jgi:predicted secreted protein
MSGMNVLYPLLICVIYAGCTKAENANNSGTRGPVLTLSQQDDGKTIETKVGQSILLQLPVQSGTGYGWYRRSEDHLTVTPENDTVADNPKPGAKKIQIFRIEATQPGDVELLFEYRRGWEQHLPPAATFRIRVSAKK